MFFVGIRTASNVPSSSEDIIEVKGEPEDDSKF